MITEEDRTSVDAAGAALRALCDTLIEPDRITRSCCFVDAEALPGDYRELLVHHDHMTTRLGQYFGRPVAVRVLAARETADSYRRMIVLTLQGSEQVVEFGLVWIDLRAISREVRAEILAASRPLGDILISNGVLRRVEPKWYTRFEPGSVVAGHLGAAEGEAVYGRIGVIHYEHKPAIRLLEVVRAGRQEVQR